MRKILGLDIGVSSIGWSVITLSETEPQLNQILGMGSRIIPLKNDPDEATSFSKGKGETVCHKRTVKRSVRRGHDRRQQRKQSLKELLKCHGLFYPDVLNNLDPLQLWRLRARAATCGEKLELPEIGRIIYHINQRRGYKSAKGEAGDNTKSQYLSVLSERAREASGKGQTPGQYFASYLKESEHIGLNGSKDYSYRIKEKVFPRTSYEEELRQILANQSVHYPDILTPAVQDKIFNVVFYQRPLKSCTYLISLCEFEAREITDKDGKKRKIGPKVAPVTSPLSQVCRIWETINNIELKNNKNKHSNKRQRDISDPDIVADRLQSYVYPISLAEKKKIFDFLNTHEIMKTNDLFKILGLKKDDGFTGNKMLANGIKGNITRCFLQKALAGIDNTDELLRFNLKFVETGQADEITGELIKKVDSDYLKEPLYQLWHTLYSIDDYENLKTTLENKFGITDSHIIDRLYQIDFRSKGHTNKSSKFMSRLIPLLMEGYLYSEACGILGINHSASMTKEENQKRELCDSIPLILKGELHQPVVEKILNQMIHLVNDIILKYGSLDEIHVELARTLKQNKEERSETYSRIKQLERENKEISNKIIEECHLKSSRNRIWKYKMWEESGHICMYCGKPIGCKEFLLGIDAEKEHIIPRSLYFNDSFSNTVCSCRSCNALKGQMTAYDFMKSQPEEKFNEYIDRVDNLYNRFKLSKGKSGISKTKHKLLLTTKDEIPRDFIDRDLRQTQYISRKSMELLRLVCRDVIATSGSVTGFFRHIWGYDEILHTLNLPFYKESGHTETVKFEHHGQVHTEERIIDWSKILDHRHHALDALTIALTRRAHIQRLNTLNARTEDENVKNDRKNLEKWALSQFHFSFSDVRDMTAEILVSFKAGKKVTTPGKRKVFKKGKSIIVQSGLSIPRGPLSEEHVYGKVRIHQKDTPMNNLFLDPQSICSPSLRKAVTDRLHEFENDASEAIQSIKKRPIIVNETPVQKGTMLKDEYPIKLKISEITNKNLNKIIDKHIRDMVETRFKEVGFNDIKFQQSLTERPLYSDKWNHHVIKSVRCRTGISKTSISAVRKNKDGIAIGFAKNGNNHHVAIYKDKDGNMYERTIPFWQAVKRKRLGLPVIIENIEAYSDRILALKDGIEESISNLFPLPGSEFMFSMQLNEMFILGLPDDRIRNLITSRDYTNLSRHIYRVQNLSSMDYKFTRHICTLTETTSDLINGNYIRIRSLVNLQKLNPKKIKIDRLGEIIAT